MTVEHVKVCGLTRAEDVANAVGYGVWAVGFVNWPASPRTISVSRIRELASAVPSTVQRVGVVVNPTLEEARTLRDEGGITTLQLHGDEDVLAFLDLGIDVIKATPLETDDDLDRAAALPPEVTVLVDARDPVRRGGTGERADWIRAAELSRRRRVILAGGLRADNVRQAVAQVKPWGIDVSSGLEIAPGLKDPAKIRGFFAALRAGGGEL